MNRIISNNSKQIQSLLNFWAQSFGYKVFNVIVYIFPGLPKLL